MGKHRHLLHDIKTEWMNKWICTSLPIILCFWIIFMCQYLEGQNLHGSPVPSPQMLGSLTERLLRQSKNQYLTLMSDSAIKMISGLNIQWAWEWENLATVQWKGNSGLGKAPRLWFAESAFHVQLMGGPRGTIRAARSNWGQKSSSLPECFCYPSI